MQNVMQKVSRKELKTIMKEKEFCAFNFRDAAGNFSCDSKLPVARVELQTTDGKWYYTTMEIFESFKKDKFSINAMQQ